jgi:Fe-S cluster biogenesis protein NfuA
MALDRKHVEKVIAVRLAPLFAVDGGRVDLVSVNDNRGAIRVRFEGSYRACPSREILARRVLEPTLRQELPELRVVEWID